MKAKIRYCIAVEKEIDVSPEEYCELHANTNFRDNMYFPKDSYNREIILDNDARATMNDYFYSRCIFL